jgi:nitroreductase
METFDAIRTVLSVRSFKDQPIPPDAVHQIVEAAHLTASSQNGQPWHFIVVQNKDMLARLGSLVKTGPYITQASLAIVVAMEQSPFAVADASRAIQSMILAAWSLGIGSNWTGFNNLDQINPVLAIPSGIKVLAVIPFGYPVKPGGKGKKNRKPLGQVAHKERWDQPYS